MITKDYTKFFRELEKNNSKAWFHAHKKDYEQFVKAPFVKLVEELLPEVEKLEPKVDKNPKSALFRINRDIRFSADKSPYNTLMKAGFSADGKKSQHPGYYLGVSADHLRVGGGLFMLKPPMLKRVRQQISSDPGGFNSIVSANTFVEAFGELKGEKAKRVDPVFREQLKTVPLIANKQFYVMRELDIVPYLSSDELQPTILKYFREVSALNDFLKKAFQ